MTGFRWLLGIGELFFSALVLQLLWRWHVAETFAIPRLSYGEAFGLTLVLTYATYRYRDTRAWKAEDWGDFIANGWSALVFVLGVGALVEVAS